MTKDDMNPTRTKASPVEEGLLKAAEKSAVAETKLEEEVGALYGQGRPQHERLEELLGLKQILGDVGVEGSQDTLTLGYSRAAPPPLRSAAQSVLRPTK